MDRPLELGFGQRIREAVLDVGPPVLIGAEGLVAIAVAARVSGQESAWLLLALGVACVALAWRRRRPIHVLAVTVVLNLAVNWGPIGTLPLLVAVFSVAEQCGRRALAASAATAAGSVLVTPSLHGMSPSVKALGSRLIVVGLAVALGMYVRARAAHVAGLRERAERLEREQELLAEQAVAEERVRIARELHDVVAHNVSLMVVQSQALAATGGSRDEQQLTLGRVADLGREALSEMHRMLGVLRLQDGDGTDRAPQPGIHDLEDLVGRTRAAGLDAELVLVGRPRELPPGVELSVYRIAQEALTNVIRHARARHATVRLAFREEALELTVTDDGAGAAHGSRGGAGHGLVGMRERVALLGGGLETGPVPDARGYRVHARLPVH
jgi:signal transduction histidine kinase